MIKILKNRYFPYLFAIPLFICVYHYNGIVMDGILYVSQYIHSVDPTRFLRDPIFEFGNQGSLGLFAPFFGVFVRMFGVDKGAFLYTLSMQLAWILLAICMIKTLLQMTRNKLWILPVVICFVGVFSNGMPFSYARFFSFVQSYVCSRSLSIAAGMCALIFLLKKKKLISLLLVLLGTMIHPITTGWCLPVWFFVFFPRTRLPILVLSFAFPLTFLMHKGWLDVYPEDWLSRPLIGAPNYQTFGKYFALLCFYFVFVRRLSNNLYIKEISNSFCILLIIALYWDICGGYGGHIFLYVVQPWRAMWMPSLFAVPLGLCFFKDSLRRMLKRKEFTTHDLALFMMLLSFLTVQNLYVIFLIAAYLFICPLRKVTVKITSLIFAFLLVAELLVQEYHALCMQGLDFWLGYDFKVVYRIRCSLQLYLVAGSVALILYFFFKKKYLLAIPLLLYLFFPYFQLLPFLSLYLWGVKKRGYVYFGGATIVLLVVLLDGCIGEEDRFRSVLNGFPPNFGWVFLLVFVSFLTIWMSKKFRYVPMFMWLAACMAVGCVRYDARTEMQRNVESELDAYLESSIFPQIPERGKAFFFVSGNYEQEPRLRFLTGSYFTGTNQVGNVFNINHYKTVLKREQLLYWRREDTAKKHNSIIYDEILNKLADTDTLIDRFAFLCSEKELTHLVTDKENLPFAVSDSAIISRQQKVFLYECP
jgi:hypothetical protein